MSVVRRGSAGAVVAGLVLLGGPAWAQEDPCAPGPDGSVPEMCQSGPVQSDTGTVGMEPEEPEGPVEPCPGLPVEPGDGVITDGDPGVAAGEPDPGTRPEPEGEVEPAPVQEDAPADGGTDAPLGDVFCIAASTPVADGAPEVAVGGGTATNEAVAVGRLPRTGPYDRLLALTAVGSGLVVAGAGAAAAGRRRSA